MFALFPKFGARTRTQDLWPFFISETGLKFLIWTQSKIHPGNRASPVNRAHMKRPLANLRFLSFEKSEACQSILIMLRGKIGLSKPEVKNIGYAWSFFLLEEFKIYLSWNIS